MRPPALPEIASARAELSRRASAASGEFSVDGPGTPASGETAESHPAPESYRKFEAMVLQTFIQNMLPKDAGAFYGKGMAGDMWKSLLAEKMADVMAERGGIGIADRMMGEYKSEDGKKAVAASQPVETSVAATPASVAIPAEEPGFAIAPVVLDEMQRSLTGLLSGDPAAAEMQTKSTTKRG